MAFELPDLWITEGGVLLCSRHLDEYGVHVEHEVVSQKLSADVAAGLRILEDLCCKACKPDRQFFIDLASLRDQESRLCARAGELELEGSMLRDDVRRAQGRLALLEHRHSVATLWRFVTMVVVVNTLALVAGLGPAAGGAGMFDLSAWKPPELDVYTGYAGGLGPGNLGTVLAIMHSQNPGVWGDGLYWLDMETRLRSDDDHEFLLGKCVDCLELAKPFVVDEPGGDG